MSKANIYYAWGIEDEKKGLSLTGSSSLIELDNGNGKKVSIVIDTWMFQWWKNDAIANEEIDERIVNADYIIITHPHMDHVGKLPYIIKKWFKGKILMTEITKQCAIHMLSDNVKLTKRAIEDVKKKNKKTIEKYKELLKIKNLFERTQERNIDKIEKNKAKSTLWKTIGDDKAIKTKYQEVTKELQEKKITCEADITKYLEETPVLLYDENDILSMIDFVRNLEIGEEIKLEKTLYIFDLENKYVEKLPEMVKTGYTRNVYVYPLLKAAITQKWNKMLDSFNEQLYQNQWIQKQNDELSEILEKTLSYVKYVDEWTTPKDEEYYSACKEMLSTHKVEDYNDIKRALKPIFKAPFNKNDIEEAKKLLREDPKMMDQKIISEFKVKFLDAWHIEWSVQAQISLTTQKVTDIIKGNIPAKEVKFEDLTLVLSGDLWRIKDPNLAGTPEIPTKEIDYYQIETTYAGRIHRNKELAKSDFFASIRRSLWKVVVPTFSMQRTQEILMMLLEKTQESLSFAKEIQAMKKEKAKLKALLSTPKLSLEKKESLEAKITQLERHIDLLTPELFDYEIVLDSPLSQKITQVYLTNKWITYKLLSPWVQELIFGKSIVRVLEYWQYKEIYHDRNLKHKKQIILSSWGMCQGWSVLNHLVENIPNENSTITFVWYTPPNTIGWKLKPSFTINQKVYFLWESIQTQKELIKFITKLPISDNDTVFLSNLWDENWFYHKNIETILKKLGKKVKIVINKTVLTINDKELEWKCRVDDINGFSWHADEEEIITFLADIPFSRNATIALTHGWEERYKLAKKIEIVMDAIGKKVKVVVPKLGDTTTLKL